MPGQYKKSDCAAVRPDPVPDIDYKLISESDIQSMKKKILASGLSVPDLVRTAWASAASFRSSDLRGGANGARISLAPQKDWAANDPAELAKVLKKLEEVRKEFNGELKGGKQISLADTIVLAGAAAIEKAAQDAPRGGTLRLSAGATQHGRALREIYHT